MVIDWVMLIVAILWIVSVAKDWIKNQKIESSSSLLFSY